MMSGTVPIIKKMRWLRDSVRIAGGASQSSPRQCSWSDKCKRPSKWRVGYATYACDEHFENYKRIYRFMKQQEKLIAERRKTLGLKP